MLPSSQQCSSVPQSLLVSTQHFDMAFLSVRPSLTHCMNCRVRSQLWCIYGAKFVSGSPRCPVYVLFFQHPMHYTPRMQCSKIRQTLTKFLGNATSVLVPVCTRAMEESTLQHDLAMHQVTAIWHNANLHFLGILGCA